MVEFLYRIDNTKAQEIEVGAAVHGSFEELEPVDISFDGAIAPAML